MKNKAVYFEKLSLSSLLIVMISNIGIRNIFLGFNIYYFDLSIFARKILLPVLVMFNVLVKRLHFRMVDIKDEKGELLRLRIPRKDLFVIQDKIIKSEAFNSFSNETWKQNSFLDFIMKGVIDGDITEERSVSRVLYLVSVVDWHMQKNKFSRSIFAINNRPWFNIYSEYASVNRIKLTSVKVFSLFLKKTYLKNFIRNHIKLYVLIKNLKYNLSVFIGKTKLPLYCFVSNLLLYVVIVPSLEQLIPKPLSHRSLNTVVDNPQGMYLEIVPQRNNSIGKMAKLLVMKPTEHHYIHAPGTVTVWERYKNSNFDQQWQVTM